jgi:hypothetical protein
MKKESSRGRIAVRVVALSLCLGLLMSLLGVAGCDSEKRIKECVAHCEEAAHACEQRKEPACEAHGRECAEACRK